MRLSNDVEFQVLLEMLAASFHIPSHAIYLTPTDEATLFMGETCSIGYFAALVR
jgi:hypothetical protein